MVAELTRARPKRKRARVRATQGGRRALRRAPIVGCSLASVLLTGAILTVGGAAHATPEPGSFERPAPQRPPVGGFTSDNVEWLGNIELQGAPPASSGRLVGRYFYVRGAGIEIFDVSDPVNPQRVAALPMPAPCCGGFEDLETNGRILLFSTCCESFNGPGDLLIIDVEDKSNPQEIARLEGEGAHTYTCIFDCKYAYGSNNGHVIDLRDPANPKVVNTNWALPLEFHNPPPIYTEYKAHDLTEVRPGVLLTASNPMYLLDARRNPIRPRVIARSDGSPYSFGGTAWARNGRDDFIVSWSEALQLPRCEPRDASRDTSLDSAFKTWDAAHWRETGLITGVDEFYVENGTYVDGNPSYSGAPPGFAGCSASWFDLHPRFRNGGLMAAAASGHGLRFLEVADNGRLSELGYFLPHAGNTVAAYWISDEIVYTTDGQRGIDILRFRTEAGA